MHAEARFAARSTGTAGMRFVTLSATAAIQATNNPCLEAFGAFSFLCALFLRGCFYFWAQDELLKEIEGYAASGEEGTRTAEELWSFEGKLLAQRLTMNPR